MTLYVKLIVHPSGCVFFRRECVTKTLNISQLHYDLLSIHFHTQKLNFYKNIILIVRV